MGLFDKRKRNSDDFDSPVENIDLSAQTDDPPAEPTDLAAAAAPASEEEPHREPEPERIPEPDPEPEPPPYGINDAIQLMRALPQDNIELVVQVVKRTLESTRVEVTTIIDDATAKQGSIESRIAVLKAEISDYEQEIATRKEEIATLEADHEETSTVKDRLQLAQKLTTGKPAAQSKPAQAAKPGNGGRPASGNPPPTPSTGTASASTGSTAKSPPKGTITIKK